MYIQVVILPGSKVFLPQQFLVVFIVIIVELHVEDWWTVGTISVTRISFILFWTEEINVTDVNVVQIYENPEHDKFQVYKINWNSHWY